MGQNKNIILERILSDLNEAQKRAVTSPPTGQLQVVAGPGTGKTKVLTSRVAYLVLYHNIDPLNIMVTTFTKKAANEMVERLESMLKGSDIDLKRLLIGTFHSISNRLLQRFGHFIDIKGFRIANERDSDGIMKEIVEKLEGELAPLLQGRTEHEVYIEFTLKKNQKVKKDFDPKRVSSLVSKLKSEGNFSTDYAADPRHNRCLLRFFEEYDKKMMSLGYLDFDDLLLYTNKLLKSRKCLRTLKYLLVDEFQDTNNIQLQLISNFGIQNVFDPNNITIVGDPDQSIYAFRSAVAENFNIFKLKYPSCRLVTLNESYRSTQDVLDFSESFMRQQKGREARHLLTHKTSNFKPVFMKSLSGESEASLIAQEIKTLISLPDLYKYSDFVILIRAAYLSREIEKSLIKYRIPYSIIKGKAFWKRKEIELMVDFLRLLAYDEDILAIKRTIKECTTGIGEIGLDKLSNYMEKNLKDNIAPLNALINLVNGEAHLNDSVRYINSIKDFLKQIDELYHIYNKSPQDKEVVLEVFDKIITLEAFQKIFKKNEDALKNLTEARGYLEEFDPEEEEILYEYSDYESEVEDNIVETDNSHSDEIIGMDSAEDDTDTDNYRPPSSFLDSFIRSVDFYIEGNIRNQQSEKGTVSISTIHAAKGLEWPVVFVPCLIEGVFPTLKSLDPEAYAEERRVFYVSTTRAKHLLYLSYAPRWPEQTESSFLQEDVLKLTCNTQEAFKDVQSLKDLYNCVEKSPPVDNDLEKFVQSVKHWTGYKQSTRLGLIQGNGNGKYKAEMDVPRPAPLPPMFAPRNHAVLGGSYSVGKKKKKSLGVRRRPIPTPTPTKIQID